MKRVDALIPLSHEHHAGLVISNRINRLKSDAEAEIKDYWLAKREIIKADMIAHFEKEERYLLPLMSASNAVFSERLLQEHKALLACLESDSATSAIQFAEQLKAHIRFEERELFPWLEKHISSEMLAGISGLLNEGGRHLRVV